MEASGYSLLGEEPLEPIGQETRLCPRAGLDVLVRVISPPSCKSDANSLVIQPRCLVTILT
jgi:hypothetical protein